MPPMTGRREAAIAEHGVVGDLDTVALVALDGCIDFMCWPGFDSPSIFAALLDAERGGRFEIMPSLANAQHRQMYLPETNVLITRHLSRDGVSEISDFMDATEGRDAQRLVRRVKAVRGTIRFEMSCAPRFDYARAGAAVTAADGGAVLASTGEDGTRLRLLSTVPIAVEGDRAVAAFELARGQSAIFVLQDADAPVPEDLALFSAEAFKATSDVWRAWTARSTYRGRWREAVERSALALKLLTSRRHGSILAAATFGLPEELGGSRNWDYRYTWIRDAAFTVYGFLRLGHVAEANAFMGWLSKRPAHHHCTEESEETPLGVFYRLDGSEDRGEIELDSLAGHRGSAPVRVGNGAHDQLQLDIYGEAMDAIYLADKHGEGISWAGWENVVRTLVWLEKNWHRPDEGIWEVRGERRHFLHSRLMCWVAFDRAVRLSEKRSLPAPLERWRRARDAIRADIHENFWNEERGAFVQSLGSDSLDASCLLMPLVRFIAPTDPRWLSTLDMVGRTLADDSLVYRYVTAERGNPDGLDGLEGTFNMCSFWYVECLARAGDVEKARFFFDKMLGYGNHLGLFAEETGPAGEQLGNFPQAFTHLSLISAAYYLNRCLSD